MTLQLAYLLTPSPLPSFLQPAPNQDLGPPLSPRPVGPADWSRDNPIRSGNASRLLLLTDSVLVEDSMDTFTDLHGYPIKFISNVDLVGLQCTVTHDQCPTCTWSGNRHLPSLHPIVDCRAAAKRVCILVRKDFFEFPKKKQSSQNCPHCEKQR